MQYISKEERKIDFTDPQGKWTDLTILPEWEEEFYDVYTAKKYGKWVMLKALKEQYRDNPSYQHMLDREFETRHILAHPNIVMVNDYEVLPVIGRAIITDDVYGYSLRRLIDEKLLTPRILHRLETQLLDAMDYIQENHLAHRSITPENIIFAERGGNLKLINVGYDHRSELSAQDTVEDIHAYGTVLNEVLDNMPGQYPRLRRIARIAAAGDPVRRFRTIPDLRLAIERKSPIAIYIYLGVFVAAMTTLLCWLAFR